VNGYVNKLRLSIASAAASALLAGCGGGGSNGIPKISSVNPLSTGKLQFAVGTANLYGLYTGLNVVSTYRQSNGLSNVLVDTPTITGPFKLPAAAAAGNLSFDPYSTLPGGPSVEEVAAGGQIFGTSQSLHPGTPACDQTTACTVASASGGTVTVAPNTSTFGQAGGVFTNGISPGNSTTGGVASSYVPYTQPFYDSVTTNTFVDFGGPPAFDPNGDGLGLRDGLSNLGKGVLGIPEGITTFFGVTPSIGTYSLSLQVPTGFSGTTPTYGTVATTATLGSTAKLGTLAAPTLTLDGKGGGTFTVPAFPAGVIEVLVQIVDFGVSTGVSCQGAIGASEGAGPAYYTILVKAPGAYSLPDTIGPNTSVTSGAGVITPSPSICTAAQNTAAAGTATAGDTYTVQAIGADYPLYESLYPNSASQTPTLTGSNGQADITISASSGNIQSAARQHMVLRHIR
jgi:hypothetical protein